MSGAGVGHLSIGEVLSLVQEDFPDVTISKIRFLESQGLIAPERTAAGYRKFYDSDIERLRWILRQQRDNFLPLKVIRKMLDEGVDVSPEEQPTLWSSAATGPAEGDAGASSDPTATGSERVDAPAPQEHSQREQPDAEPAVRSPAHPAVASSRRPAPARAPARAAASGGAGRGAAPVAEPDDDPTPAETPAAARRPAYSTPADVVAALQEDPRRGSGPVGGGASTRKGSTEDEPPDDGASARTAPRGPERSPAVPAVSAPPEQVRMNRDELCEATGMSPEAIDELERFGLVAPTVLGGDPQYDADALAVVRIASRYAELGVGARHLRMYKVAAEREAGFVEQLVVPLLKQRNPRARDEAAARADELQRMGAELHATLLRRGLGPTLGG